MSDTGGGAVDFTKFDPISGNIYDESGATTDTVTGGDLATKTQGVATYIANLVVSGSNEKINQTGGSVSDIANTAKDMFANLATLVDGAGGSQIDFTGESVILDVLGDGFNATSTTLERIQTDFENFDPENNTGILTTDQLIEKQLIAQSEFGDGILTAAEAANGALLVVGPTYEANNSSTEEAKTGSIEVVIQNIDPSTNAVLSSVTKTITFSGSKYGSVDLSAEDLTDLGGIPRNCDPGWC